MLYPEHKGKEKKPDLQSPPLWRRLFWAPKASHHSVKIQPGRAQRAEAAKKKRGHRGFLHRHMAAPTPVLGEPTGPTTPCMEPDQTSYPFTGPFLLLSLVPWAEASAAKPAEPYQAQAGQAQVTSSLSPAADWAKGQEVTSHCPPHCVGSLLPAWGGARGGLKEQGLWRNDKCAPSGNGGREGRRKNSHPHPTPCPWICSWAGLQGTEQGVFGLATPEQAGGVGGEQGQHPDPPGPGAAWAPSTPQAQGLPDPTPLAQYFPEPSCSHPWSRTALIPPHTPYAWGLLRFPPHPSMQGLP